jgi:hypothetical protein
MKRLILGLLALLAISGRASALDPKTIETDWNQKTFSISTSGVTSATFDIGGFGANGFAILGSSYTQNGVDGTTYGATAVVSSTTKNVVGFDYIAFSSNSFSMQISQTLRTPVNPVPSCSSAAVPSGTFWAQSSMPSSYCNSAPVISTSSVINFPPSQTIPLYVEFRAVTSNPIFRLTNITAGSTVYLTVDYGIPRVP